MRWTGKLAVVGIAAILSVPAVLADHTALPVVGSHTTYANMDGQDPCIAGIAGIVRMRVMWFNGQVLFERAAEEGSSWVYAIESGAPDPRDAPLQPTGQVFQFVDPNGVGWTVTEYNFTSGVNASVPSGGGVSADPLLPPDPHVTPPDEGGAEVISHYVWVVQTGPTMSDLAATGRPYNFVNLVDTCKFTGSGSSISHDKDAGGNWTSSKPGDDTTDQHVATDGNHAHGAFNVDLYVGKAPKVLVPEGGDLGVPQ